MYQESEDRPTKRLARQMESVLPLLGSFEMAAGRFRSDDRDFQWERNSERTGNADWEQRLFACSCRRNTSLVRLRKAKGTCLTALGECSCLAEGLSADLPQKWIDDNAEGEIRSTIDDLKGQIESRNNPFECVQNQYENDKNWCGNVDRLIDWQRKLEVVGPARAPRPAEAEPTKRRGNQVRPMSLEDADAKVADIIRADGWPGSTRKMADEVGCSHELVRQCPSAELYIDRKEPKPKLDTSGQDVASVTDPAGDPLEGMAFREEFEAMLKELPAEDRQKVEGMTPQRQRELVDSWQSQKRDKAEDSRPRYTHRRQKV